MNFNVKYFLIVFILLVLSISVVSANEIDNVNATSIRDESSTIESADGNEFIYENNSQESETLRVSSQDSLQSNDENVIVVNNWDELQYYCSLNDKDYTLKLKENTNFYPTNPTDSNYQIKINNNIKIIGSMGSYMGDSSFHRCYISSDGTYYVVEGGQFVTYNPIIVPDNNGKSLTLENITFKWFNLKYSPDAKFIQLGGNGNYVFKNCNFGDICTVLGNGAIVFLKKGKLTLDNCSFVNCSTPKGIIDIYGRQFVTVRDCYFANNYAYEHTTCIKNYGNLKVYNTKFYKNRSAAWAGGITTYDQGVTDIYNCNFTGNLAGWNGGALYCYNIMNIYNSTFVDNNCTTNNGGGAIGACQFQGIPRIYIENSLFKDNNNLCWGLDDLSTTGTGRGGAISFMDSGSIEVRNTVFIANSASMGTAICAIAVGGYGSPDIIIVNNTFINHTRAGDVLNVSVFEGSILNVSGNYYLNNSIEFSNLTLTPLSTGDEQATFKVTAELAHPYYYEADILDRTLYDVYINNKYVKTVNSTIFSIDFGDLDICDVYVIPTISNRKSNEVTVTSAREYIFVCENGNDNNNGISRDSPVKTIKKALELAIHCKNIILLDGNYSESIEINYDVLIKGENGASLTNSTSFIVNNDFTLKNIVVFNLQGDYFVKQNNGKLIVENCILKNNNVSNLIDARYLEMSKSIIINNNALIINNNNYASVKDSIILNNADVLKGSSNYSLDYNWWGNILDNLNKPNNLNINNWIVLNATSNVYKLENNHNAQIQFGFYLNNTKYLNLPEITLKLTSVNGTANINHTLVNSKVIFTLTGYSNASLIAEYNNVATTLNFEFLKSNPNVSVKTTDVMFGDELIIQVTVPSDSEGNITVSIANITKTSEITGSNSIFNFTNFKAGTYLVNVSYSGDKKYKAQIKTTNVNVNKYNSFTNLNLSDINVNEDLFIQITVPSDATGNVSLYINNKFMVLTLADAQANYTINSIVRGDYIVCAVYNGNDKYLESKDSIKIEVDNLISSMEISAEDIVYGENAVINVKLNDDATGNVSVTIDEVTNMSTVVNGQANILLSNLEAGVNKNITVFYTGDDTYFNRSETSHFTISKAELTFTISSDDIKIGQEEIIKIKVPAKTSGTFTIGEDTIVIPLSGSVDYVISDLEIGEYEVTAVYNGNNYNTVSNSTSFRVSEYPIPQWSNQGFDTRNTGKSHYETLCNGEILFNITVNEKIIGSLTIDSEGNIYVTTSNEICSYDCQGNLRYVFTPDTRESSFSGTAIGRDVVISPKSGDTLYFINQTTGEKYGSSNLYQGSSIFAPIIDSNANIYIISEYQVSNSRYSLVKIPYKMWEFGGSPILVDLSKAAPLCSPTVSDDVIVVVSENRIRVLDAHTLQSNFIKSGDYANIRPIIGEGNIIYAVLSDSIVAYSISGSQLWKTKVTGGIGGSLVLDDDNGLYFVNAKGILYRYDLDDGKESKVSDLNITSNILVGHDGTLFFGCDKTFYAIGSNGDVLWKSDIGSVITGSPVMDKNGLIYITTNDGITALGYAPLKDLEISVNVSDVFVGENLVFDVDIPSDACGFIILNFNGQNYTVRDNVVFDNLPANFYDYTLVYSGDAKYNPRTLNGSVSILKLNTTLSVGVGDIEVGENATFIVLTSVGYGDVVLTVNNNDYNVTINDNIGQFSLPDLGEGNYEVVVKFLGDGTYNSCINTTSFRVLKVELPINNETIQSSNLSTYSICLPVDATGAFTVIVDGENYTETLTKGKATVNIPELSVGSHNITVVYSGDSKYSPIVKSVIVNKTQPPHVPIIRLTGFDLTMLYTSGKYFKVRLTSDGAPLEGQTVKITINGNAYSRTTDSNGYASLKISLPPKTYTVKATYGNLTVTKKVTVKSIITAKNINSKRSAKTVKIKVTLKKVNGKYLKNKKITLKFNKKTFKVKTNKKGVATFTIKNSVYKKLKTNKKYTYQVIYGKDKVKKTIKFKK